MVSYKALIEGLFIFILILLFSILPVQAGMKYYSGGPDLSVAIQGSNELNPGDTMTLPVLVENAGKIDMKMISSGAVTPDYLPDTARTVRISLDAGDSPLIIRSDTQALGDIPSGISEPAQFVITVPEDAIAGEYLLPVHLSYEYVPEATEVGEDDIEYIFKDETKEENLQITIRPKVSLRIDSIDTRGLYAGGEGYITFHLTNVGKDSGKSTVILIEPPQGSPVTPVDSAIFIGDFPVGSKKEVKFKVAVNADANDAQEYPIDVVASYRDYEGLDTQSPPKTTGLKFGGKITFVVSKSSSTLNPGGSAPIQVTYKNTGNYTAYHAQARISLVDPFSSDDDSSYLGDLKPGEESVAVFTITTDPSATLKEYALDSTIRYTDEENNSYLSDPIKVVIQVRPADMTSTYLSLVVIILIIAGGWYLYKRRKDQ